MKTVYKWVSVYSTIVLYIVSYVFNANAMIFGGSPPCAGVVLSCLFLIAFMGMYICFGFYHSRRFMIAQATVVSILSLMIVYTIIKAVIDSLAEFSLAFLFAFAITPALGAYSLISSANFGSTTGRITFSVVWILYYLICHLLYFTAYFIARKLKSVNERVI